MNDKMNYPSGPPENHPSKGLAIASLVMGILSLTLDGIVFGILGIVFSVVAKKNGFTGGIATAGFVMSVVGLALGVVILIVCGPMLCTLLGL